MTAHDFTLWLQGFLDAGGDNMSAAEVAAIRDKLATVVAAPLLGLGQLAPSRVGFPITHTWPGPAASNGSSTTGKVPEFLII